MKYKNLRKAFSMIELIFVITVIGIIASVGSSAIANMFQGYIAQKATSDAAMKSELAALQIANRLSHAIPWTVIAKQPGNNANIVALSSLGAVDNTRTALEWVGVDNDSFSATETPGWSGYCEVQSSTRTDCPTYGSNLADANTIIRNLSNNAANLASSAVFFKNPYFTRNTTPPTYYDPACIGMKGDNNTTCTNAITGTTATPSLTFASVPRQRVEEYALAWTAYAIVPENARVVNGNTVFDLAFYYNYRPWRNQTYAAGTKTILVNNVSVFRFTQNDNIIRFKICVMQPIGSNATDMITLCKEKAVVR